MYLDIVAFDPTATDTITELTIAFPFDNGYPARLVRDALRFTPNVEILILFLPRSTPVNILDNLHLNKLVGLMTNLPHGHLAPFLSNHPAIDTLILRARGCHTPCPLRDLDLRHVKDLECPSRCFSGIARGQITNATVNLSRQSSMSSLAIHSLSASPLHTLTIDFYPNDYDILSRIAAVIPNLRRLKLVEKPRAQVHTVLLFRGYSLN